MKRNNQAPLAARLWEYQAERSPFIPMVAMAAVSAGVLYRFSHTSFTRYLICVVIITLYLVQVRTADEKKDLEHDNHYYPKRPVQRGLVSLSELATIGRAAIAIQLVLYASFLDPLIFLLGLLSQGYAYLTRREFYVRDWIKPHFFIYYFAHYVQLVILFFVMTDIIHPTSRTAGQLLLFVMLNIAVTELGRKNLPKDQDVAGDTYSSHLGYRGTAIAASLAALLNVAYTAHLMAQNTGPIGWIALPLITTIAVLACAYRYAVKPVKANQTGLANAVMVNYVAAMLGLIVGAR
ncbi:MAG: rane protein [Patescibacteria group bacterium]|nr:rane protein [Patescibacteria group bacterium]